MPKLKETDIECQWCGWRGARKIRLPRECPQCGGNVVWAESLALKAAGALVTYFMKTGEVSGHFSPTQMAEVIERVYANKRTKA